MRSSAKLFLLLLAIALGGCASVFRDSKPKVAIESEPSGAEARVRDNEPKPTPMVVEVDRSGTTDVVVSKPGYQDHRAIIKKKMNGGWLALDITTCVIPIALCIPLLIDAITGAWTDVETTHHARLEPLAAGATPVASATPPPTASATPAPSTAPPPPNPGAGMSDSERKAAARAAYLEGAALQEKGDCANALPKFETAQKLYDAPTHLHHIAQCQAATGKLVEAQETYESLNHQQIPPSAPDAFKQAQESGKKELPSLQARIPKLSVALQPAPASLPNLLVTVNGKKMPNELLGIGRPINPGTYRVQATATGYKTATVEVTLKEGETKPAEITLTK